MNAFADPFSNSIVLTKSIIESLSVEELQAVVKHELCHLSHRWLWLFVLVLHVVLIHFSIFNDSLVEQTLVIRILLFILLMSVLRVIRKVLARFSENRADDKYLASDSEKHTLAKALIHIYRERLIPSKSSIFSAHRDLPTRIRRLAPDLVYEIPDDRHVHKDIQRKLLLLFTLALLPPLSLLIPLIILDINLNLPATGFMLFGLLCALILDSLISHYTKKLKQFHALPWFLRGSRRLLLALSVGGFLSVLALYYWGVTVRGASLLIFLELVITIAVIDAIYLVIPHPLTICGITLSGFMSYWTTNAWLISLVPIIVCVVALCTFNRISKILLNRPMIGGGDIMLVTMVGGYLGYDALRSILLLTIIFSLLCMLAPCLRRRASAGEFPLGPVISLFSMIILLTGTI